mgnify:CR=1 FL=1
MKRQKAKISVVKRDSETKKEIKGAVLWIVCERRYSGGKSDFSKSGYIDLEKPKQGKMERQHFLLICHLENIM